MKTTSLCILYVIAGAGLSMTGCQRSTEQTLAMSAPASVPSAAQAPIDKAAVGKAQVQIGALGTSGVSGQIALSALADGAGVQVQGQITGLKPGPHGMHVHEVGRCEPPDGLSAGGHFNPTAAPHGRADAAVSHVGDLGNIVADAHGVAAIDLIKAAATLNGPATLIGRSIIIHQDADDLASQPAGNSGVRVGCGVIRAL